MPHSCSLVHPSNKWSECHVTFFSKKNLDIDSKLKEKKNSVQTWTNTLVFERLLMVPTFDNLLQHLFQSHSLIPPTTFGLCVTNTKQPNCTNYSQLINGQENNRDAPKHSDNSPLNMQPRLKPTPQTTTLHGDERPPLFNLLPRSHVHAMRVTCCEEDAREPELG